jgi:hypothetical protein
VSVETRMRIRLRRMVGDDVRVARDDVDVGVDAGNNVEEDRNYLE